MRIFISYSSKYQALCDRLQLALEADGRHEVFVDRTELTPGRPFDETLRKGIEDCDLLIFLISPESVASGSYALSELGMAKRRWRHPGGHVLPVKVAPTPKEAFRVLARGDDSRGAGDVVAETVAAVDAIRPPSRRGRTLQCSPRSSHSSARLQWRLPAMAKAAYGRAQVTALSAAARQLRIGGPRPGMAALRRGHRTLPGPAALRTRARLRMRWHREIQVREGKQTSPTS